MSLIYEKISEQTSAGTRKALQVCGCRGRLWDLVIPEEADGLPVRAIRGHAFEHNRELRSAILPQSLKTLRSFAFYDCTRLSSMELFNTTDDYYDGVIRRCVSLRFVTVHCILPDNYIIVREMLNDVDGTLSFRLLTPGGELRLTFPEYVNEAREDTMARAIHFSIEGAGMAYRECIGKHAIDLAGYDRLLGRLTGYDFDVAARIAMERLAFPAGLSKKAEKSYEDFLRENDRRALEGLVREGPAGSSADMDKERREGLRVLLSRELVGREALEQGLQAASEAGETQIAARLMAYRSHIFPQGGAALFTLDW